MTTKPTPQSSVESAEKFLKMIAFAESGKQQESWKDELLKVLQAHARDQPAILAKAVSETMASLASEMLASQREAAKELKSTRSEIGNDIQRSLIPRFFYAVILMVCACITLSSYFRGQQLQAEMDQLTKDLRMLKQSEAACKEAVILMTQGNKQGPAQVLKALAETGMSIEVLPTEVTISGKTRGIRFLRPKH